MIPIVITGRSSGIVANRCKELGIVHIYQGVSDKKSKLLEVAQLIGIPVSEIAYIGDDVNDLECMSIVGYSACPADSVKQVKKSCDYVCAKNGGDGAVREFIDYLLEQFVVGDLNES